VLIAVLIIPIGLELSGQAERFSGLQAYDLYGRFAAWNAGLQIFIDSPWGIGPGQFEIVSPAYERALFSEKLILTPSSHNTYLRVLAENGLIGFIILFIGLLLIFWNSVLAASHSIKHNSMADAAWLYSCLSGILAESVVIDTLHWRHLWIIAGLVLAYRKLQLMRFKE
jgi:O-antigen ligase